MTAGVLALTSAAPSLAPHKVGLSLVFVVLLTIVEPARSAGVRRALRAPDLRLRGGDVRHGRNGGREVRRRHLPAGRVPNPLVAGAGVVGVFVLLQAFSSGSAALTGVEAISNGVGAFRRPKGKNAALTLVAMGAIAIALFLGVSYLAVSMHAAPSSSVSVISEIARATFPASSPTSALYYAVQALTFAILILAANTSYQGFPRLGAVLARDRFFPRQFVNLGDRLVYSNGIVVLAGIASLLIWAFKADVIALIHLYVIGVFTAFTISQTGMVRYWLRREEPGWRWRAAVNGTGAAATGLVAILVVESKFAEGAWAVMVAIPLLVLGFYGIHSTTGRSLGAFAPAPPRWRLRRRRRTTSSSTSSRSTPRSRRRSGTRAGSRRGIRARSTSPGSAPTRASGHASASSRRYDRTSRSSRRRTDARRGDRARLGAAARGVELRHRRRARAFRHRSLVGGARRTEFSLKLRLLREPGVVISNVPVQSDRASRAPERIACRILVSGGHAASMRAVRYAETLGLDDTRAVFFAFDADEADECARSGPERAMPMYRSRSRRRTSATWATHSSPTWRITADPGALAAVIMPELVFSGLSRTLHNQRALYIKRLLLFEPRVVLSSVPYRLD